MCDRAGCKNRNNCEDVPGDTNPCFEQAEATAPPPVSPSILKRFVMRHMLAKKHTSMKVSAGGLIGRIARGNRPDRLDRHLLAEMLGNMEQVADRFYAGDVKAIDEFLQLYCLDDARPGA